MKQRNKHKRKGDVNKMEKDMSPKASSSKANDQRSGREPVDRANPAPSAIPTAEQTALARQTAMNADNPQPSHSARDEIARQDEETRKKIEASRTDTAEYEAEQRAQAKLAARERAKALGWKRFPEEVPKFNSPVLGVLVGNNSGPAIQMVEYRANNGVGTTAGTGLGTWYGNDGGSYSRFAGEVAYWRNDIEAPPPEPR